MLEMLNNNFRLLAKEPAANTEQLEKLKTRYPSIPKEYLELAKEATQIELQHSNGQYIRIWGPLVCADMDDGYTISKRILDAIPIGDDGGGQVIFFMNGVQEFGLYHVGYGNLDAEDAIFLAPTLTALLYQGIGIDTF